MVSALKASSNDGALGSISATAPPSRYDRRGLRWREHEHEHEHEHELWLINLG